MCTSRDGHHSSAVDMLEQRSQRLRREDRGLSTSSLTFVISCSLVPWVLSVPTSNSPHISTVIFVRIKHTKLPPPPLSHSLKPSHCFSITPQVFPKPSPCLYVLWLTCWHLFITPLAHSVPVALKHGPVVPGSLLSAELARGTSSSQGSFIALHCFLSGPWPAASVTPAPSQCCAICMLLSHPHPPVTLHRTDWWEGENQTEPHSVCGKLLAVVGGGCPGKDWAEVTRKHPGPEWIWVDTLLARMLGLSSGVLADHACLTSLRISFS